MSITVTGKANGSLDAKRLYVQGLVLSSPCPGCGEVIEQDLAEDYLSYPTVGEPTKCSFYHGDCPKPAGKWSDTEWSEWVQFDFTAKAVEAPKDAAE